MFWLIYFPKHRPAGIPFVLICLLTSYMVVWPETKSSTGTSRLEGLMCKQWPTTDWSFCSYMWLYPSLLGHDQLCWRYLHSLPHLGAVVSGGPWSAGQWLYCWLRIYQPRCIHTWRRRLGHTPVQQSLRFSKKFKEMSRRCPKKVVFS